MSPGKEKARTSIRVRRTSRATRGTVFEAPGVSPATDARRGTAIDFVITPHPIHTKEKRRRQLAGDRRAVIGDKAPIGIRIVPGIGSPGLAIRPTYT